MNSTIKSESMIRFSDKRRTIGKNNEKGGLSRILKLRTDTIRYRRKGRNEYQRKVRASKYASLYVILNPVSFLISLAYIGHSFYHWHPSNGEYVTGINKVECYISIPAMFIAFKRAIAFLVTIYETRPFLRMIVTNGFPEEKDLRAISSHREILSTIGEVYALRWLPGAFSNRRVIYSYWRMKKYLNLKNEQLRTWRGETAVGILNMSWVPDLIISLSASGIYDVMLREANKFRIPTVGIVDTDSSCRGVTYPIRANDDGIKTTWLCGKVLSSAIKWGRRLSRLRTGFVLRGCGRGGRLHSDSFTKGRGRHVFQNDFSRVPMPSNWIQLVDKVSFFSNYFDWLRKLGRNTFKRLSMSRHRSSSFTSSYRFYSKKASRSWGRYIYLLFVRRSRDFSV